MKQKDYRCDAINVTPAKIIFYYYLVSPRLEKALNTSLTMTMRVICFNDFSYRNEFHSSTGFKALFRTLICDKHEVACTIPGPKSH